MTDYDINEKKELLPADRVNDTEDSAAANIAAENAEVKESLPSEVNDPINSEVNDPIKEEKKKKRNNIIANIAFLVINAIIVTVLFVVEDKSGNKADGKEVGILLGKNWIYTAITFLAYFVIIAADSLVFSVLIRKSGTKTSLALPLKVTFMGRYYDRITPWSIGGEPFQIATLMKGGLSASESCAVTMSRHIVRFYTNAILVIVILIASRISTNIYVMVVAILSVAGGLIIPSFMLLCAFRPKIGLKIGEGVIKLLHKMKIVKNYDKQYQNMQNNVNNFLSGIKYLSTNKLTIIIIALAAIIELFVTNGLPFFVLRSLGHDEAAFWRIFVLCIFVNYASSFAPTPGGAGIAELSFYAIFASYVEDGFLFWAVLLWRVAIFFIPVFIGFVMQSVESIKNIVGAKNSKK